MIDESDIEKALEWLVKNATPAAQARANKIYLLEYRKSLKAILMSKSKENTESGKEREAYSHPSYINHLEALKVAVFEDEKYSWLQTAAEAKIAMWRSQEASRRTQEQIR